MKKSVSVEEPLRLDFANERELDSQIVGRVPGGNDKCCVAEFVEETKNSKRISSHSEKCCFIKIAPNQLTLSAMQNLSFPRQE